MSPDKKDAWLQALQDMEENELPPAPPIKFPDIVFPTPPKVRWVDEMQAREDYVNRGDREEWEHLD